MTLNVFLLVLISAVLHALWNFAARKATSTLCILWLGGWLACLLVLPLVLWLPITIPDLRAALPFLIATGVVHAAYFVLLALAYEEGDISFVYPVARGTGVAGTAVVASLVIGEQLSVWGIAGISAIALGIITLGLKQFSFRGKARSELYALLVGLTIILYSVIDKAGAGLIHPVHYIFGLFLISKLLLSPYMLIVRRDETLQAWRTMKRYVFLIGPGSMITYLIVLYAMQFGKVSYIVATREVSVVIGSALGILYLNEEMSVWKGLGIVIIVGGLAFVKLAG
jgi:uncharacterized membrane protein